MISTDPETANDRPYHHGDLADALVQVAADLLESEGVGGVSLRRVAREAGVSHAAPYRHYRDKQALLEAVAAEGFRDLGRRMRIIVASESLSPRERVIAACRAYVDQVLERPERSHLMFGGLLRPENRSEALTDAAEASFGQLVALVQRGQSEGLYRQDLDAQSLAMTLWPAAHGLALLAAAGQIGAVAPGRAPADLAEQMSELLLDGVASRATAGRPPETTSRNLP